MGRQMHDKWQLDRDKSALFGRWSIAVLLFVALLCVCKEGWTAELDPFPLKPPDTSSPRETLQSFLVNTNRAATEISTATMVVNWHLELPE